MPDLAVWSELLHGELRARLGDRWVLTRNEDRVALRHRDRRQSRPVPPRHSRPPAAVLAEMERALHSSGVMRSSLLPIRWRRDTELICSAVQAIDPWVKDGLDLVWREGFIPQPVVRFTGERDEAGRLREGYLTSFVNLSCVTRIPGIDEHVALIDTWLRALSATGLHATRLTLHGSLRIWHRGPVSGITLFLTVDDQVELGDAVLLWHARSPARMASDIGCGLERLLWTLGGRPWPVAIFGDYGDVFGVDVLDAVRTATLLVMGGVRPAARGRGSALRRVVRLIPAPLAMAGLSRVVRTQRAYWATVGVTGPGWPHITAILEEERLRPASG